MSYNYGNAPVEMGEVLLDPPELMFAQYLPIKMADLSSIRIPENLKVLSGLVDKCLTGDEAYVYLTVKHLFVPRGTVQNRPGWHSDGFGTDDLNYIWCDSTPTEFCIQHFDLSDDHLASMRQMEEQARDENIITYPANTLLKLDPSVIHRPAVSKTDGFRLFVKVTTSIHKYNLRGNAHNYLFDYQWPMHERGAERNHPIK